MPANVADVFSDMRGVTTVTTAFWRQCVYCLSFIICQRDITLLARARLGVAAMLRAALNAPHIAHSILALSMAWRVT